MKKRFVQFLVGAAMTASMIGTQIPAVTAEEAAPEQATEAVVEAPAAEAPAAEAPAAEAPAAEAPAAEAPAAEAATEAQAEPEDEFVEGSALLSDYGYEAGKLDEEGWTSEFLKMLFKPATGIKMAIDDNTKLGEYYKRHGEDKMLANSEMVAKDENNGYIQMTVMVNPNAEAAEDILERFSKLEELELVSKAKDTEVAGKVFKTCTGIFNKEKYMIGVSTDQSDIAIAFKIRYKDTDSRKALLACFEEIVEEEETEEAPAEEAAPIDEAAKTDMVSGAEERGLETVTMTTPEEFEDEQAITEAAELATEDAEVSAS